MHRSILLILALLVANCAGILAQSNNLRIEFRGNKEFSSKILKNAFAECRYNLSDGRGDEEFKSGLDICLRGTGFDLYSSRGMWNIRNSTNISKDKERYKGGRVGTKLSA